MGKKISKPEDLNALRDRTRAELELRGGGGEVQITVHMGTCGIAAGAREILSELAAQLSRARVTGVTLHRSGCLGLCDQEPMVTLVDRSRKPFRYGRLDQKKVHDIVREHVVGGNPVVAYIVSQ